MICGLQKMTLLDFPGKIACTVFLGGCNFRCPFCHNAPLVTRVAETPELSEEDVLTFLKSRKGLLDGVVLSGGEPLLQSDAVEFLEKVRTLDLAVKLDGIYKDLITGETFDGEITVAPDTAVVLKKLK